MAGWEASGRQLDHYAVLGVEPTASAGQITSAYRRLVRELHPDTSPDEPAADGRFADVVAAYGTLHDPDLRAAYDSRLGVNGSKRPPGHHARSHHAGVSVRVTQAPHPADRHGPLLWAAPTRVDAPYDRPGTPQPRLPTGWDLLLKWITG